MKKVISTTIILSLLLSLFTFTVSANENETVNVLINKSINFEVMEEEFIPFDFSINTVVYPITYNDRTYIPARFLAESIGLTVTWDGTTNTVGFVDEGANMVVYDAQHGDRTPFYDTALLNKNIKFTMNGEPFVPTETDGSICYPLTYKDRTYIPARFIAEQAGLAVDWDGATQTVIIDTPKQEIEFTPTTPVEPTTPTEPQKPAEETKPEDLDLGRDGFEIWTAKRGTSYPFYDYTAWDSKKMISIPGAQELIGESLTFVEHPSYNKLAVEVKNDPGKVDVSLGNFRFCVEADHNKRSWIEMKFTGNISKYKEAVTKYVSDSGYGFVEASKDGKDYLLVQNYLVFEFDLTNNTMNLIACDPFSYQLIFRNVIE